MKKTKSYIFSFAGASLLALSANNALAQSNTLYFMKWNPQQHLLNPAYKPSGKFYIGVPGLSSIHLTGGNNSLTLTDVFHNVTVDGEKKTVLFFDHNAPGNAIDNYLDALRDRTRIFYEHRINLIDFGFRLKKGFVTFDVANRATSNVLLPKEISTLAFKGIKENQSLNIDGNDFAIDANLFTEFALGYNREINDKLQVGAKVKFLYGHANMRTDFKDLTITGNADEWSIKGDGSVMASVPGVNIVEEKDKPQIKDIEFNDDDLDASDYRKARGKGLAFDLGATYKLLPELTVSASVLDLGFIRWNKDLHKVNKKGDFVWDGIAYNIGDDTTDYGKEYQDMLDAMYEVDHSPEAYASWLAPRMYLGGEYSLWKDRLGLGLLMRSQLYRGHLYGDGVASVNFRPWRQLSATVTYGLFDGEWNNLGAGLNFNAGPINLFCAVDNIPFKYAKDDEILIPSNLENFRVSLGMNLYFGYGNPRVKKEKKTKNDAILVDDEIKPIPPIDNNDKQIANNETTPSDQTDSVKPEDGKSVNPTTPENGKETKPVTPEETKPKVVPSNLKAMEGEALYGIKFFDYKANFMAIDPKCYPVLDKLADRLNSNPYIDVTIENHSPIVKDAEFTYFLTEERAELIRGYLIEKGIEPERIQTVGMGADAPLVKDDTPTARTKNTRTVLKFSIR